MLSKEEIEVLKKLFQEVIQTKEKSDIRLKITKQVVEYLLNSINKREQLESDKQKLIEKLEEDKIELTEELKYNSTKREARMQLNLVNKYLEIINPERRK